MADLVDSELLPAIGELIEWLNWSLCSCAIKKSTAADVVNDASDDQKTLEQDEKQNGENQAPSDNAVGLDRAIWNPAIFQWLLHSFKPDLLACPSSLTQSNKEELSSLKEVFKIAQEELGVQKLLLLDDFDYANGFDKPVDTLLFLTYLTRFKSAMGNAQPACTNWPGDVNITWPFNADKDAIFLRPQTESPKCNDCQDSVLILDRFLLWSADSKDSAAVIRHRRCFRCTRCQKLLRIGLYRPTKSGAGYECLEHEKEDLTNRLTPAPEAKPKLDDDVKDAMDKVESDKPSVYPELPAEEKGPLYPQLVSPDKPADTAVAASTPDLETSTNSTGTAPDQLSPPVPGRSKSSERAAPVPAVRKSVHARSGSDTVKTESGSNLEEAVSKGSTRPERPSQPPKRVAPPPTVVLRHPEYPEDLNPFGDPETPNRRHSEMPTSSKAESSNKDQRKSMAIESAAKKRGVSPKPANEKDYDDNLNPFGSDEEAEDDDGASSLSSTNPFNESDDEEEKKIDGSKDEEKADTKKVPPPRPPPPSRLSTATPPAIGKESSKKRPAPPPPPGGPPPRPVSPKKQTRKKRPAPPRPLPLKRQIRTETAFSPEKLAVEFEANEKSLTENETAGGELETNLRQRVNEEGFVKVSNNVILEWIDLVNQKFELVRKETELVYMCRERQLDELHAEIEYQLRCIIEKPESEKTPDDMEREASLLQRMLDVIEEKSKLVDSQDEMRAQTGALPVDAIRLDDCSLSGGSKGSTLDRDKSEKKGDQKEAKKKKKIKLRLKKLKQKIASSPLLHHSS